MIPVRLVFLVAAFACGTLALPALAQDSQDDNPNITPRREERQKRPARPAPSPQADQPQPVQPPTEAQEPEQQPDFEAGESSSKDSQIDLNAGPKRGTGAASFGIEDEPRWDPHRAAKDVEVGNYYLKQKNYRAALERFRDALLYKPDDAEATYGLAVTEEKLDLFGQAYRAYNKYLEILPHGPMAKDATEGMKRMEQRLPADTVASTQAEMVKQDVADGEKFLASNQFDAARTALEHAMRLSPDNPLIAFRLAQSLQGLQRLIDARLYFRKYLELQPNGQFAADAKKNIAQLDEFLGK